MIMIMDTGPIRRTEIPRYIKNCIDLIKYEIKQKQEENCDIYSLFYALARL